MRFVGSLFAILVIISAVAAQSTITLTDLQDYQVVQRTIGASVGKVPVKGTFTGTGIVSIEARVDSFSNGTQVVAWQTVVNTPSGNQFSCTLTVPQGGWYTLTVRGVDGGGAELCRSAGTHRWGMGINVLAIGQSNMVGDGAIKTYTTVTTDLAGLYCNDNYWVKCHDPYDTLGIPTEIDYDTWSNGCTMIPAFVNSLSKGFPGIPIGIIPAAKGATTLHLHGTPPDTCWIYRDPADHANPKNLYGNSISNVRAVGGAELIIMHQGETDATYATSEAVYKADLKTLLTNYREDLNNPNLPLFICQLACSRTDTTVKFRTDSTMQRIRSAQHDSDDSTNIFLGALCIDGNVRPGDDHYFKPAYDTIGGRLGNAVKHYYFPSTYPYYRGPVIQSAQFGNAAKTKIDVFLQHRGGTDFTTSGGVSTKGFLIHNNGSPVTVNSTARIDGTCISLTMASGINSTGLLRYLYGKQPDTTGIIHDNTPLQLPLEPTTQPISITTPSITVGSPNGGETLVGQSVHQITWLYYGIIRTVKIEYSADNGGHWANVATCNAALGSYSWSVPDTASTSARIRISDSTDAWPIDESNANFTMVKKNNAPINITLDASSIDENLAAGTAVGNLSTTDPDAGQTFTYTLVTGTGSDDNASFTISGNQLKTSAVFNHELKSSYAIRVRTTDNGYLPLNFEKVFSITVNDVNETPSTANLSNNAINENMVVGTIVGNLSVSDPDIGQTVSFSLVSGTGSTDNAQFAINNGNLVSAVLLDHEVQAACSVRIRATDNGTPSLSHDSVFIITVTDVNDAPTGLSLSSQTVDIFTAMGAAVSHLSAIDQDSGETFAYTLVSGSGSTDNAVFQISSADLQTAAAIAKAEDSLYIIRIRVTDHGALYFEKSCTLTVTASNHAPTAINISSSSIDENSPAGTVVGVFSTIDRDPGDAHTFSLVAGAGSSDNGSFVIIGDTLKSSAVFDHETKSSLSIRLRVVDNGAPQLSYEQVLAISVGDVNESPSDISLTPSSVAEGAAAGTVVGRFSAVDPDSGDSHAYTLVTGVGGNDNAGFAIAGDTLKTSAIFNYESTAQLSIRIHTVDNGAPSLNFEKAFTVLILNVAESPFIISVSPAGDTMKLPLDTTILFSALAGDSDTPAESLVTGWYLDSHLVSIPLDISNEGQQALSFFVWDKTCDTVKHTWVLDVKERVVDINDTITVALPLSGRMRAMSTRGEHLDSKIISGNSSGASLTLSLLADTMLPGTVKPHVGIMLSYGIAGACTASVDIADDSIAESWTLMRYDPTAKTWQFAACSTNATGHRITARVCGSGLYGIIDSNKLVTSNKFRASRALPSELTITNAGFKTSALMFRIGIPLALSNKPLTLILYNLHGQVLATQGPSQYPAGWWTIQLQAPVATKATQGFNICELRMGSQVKRIKTIAIR